MDSSSNMTDALTKKGNWRQIHIHKTPRMPCDDEGRDQSDAFTRGETSKFASKPPEARGEAGNRNVSQPLE